MSNTSHSGFHSTAVAAVNEALVTLGQDVILTELSTASSVVQSRKAAFQYESSRLRVLRDHNWNFAKREELATAYPVGVTGPFRFAVQVPAQCVRVLACVDLAGRKCQWRMIGTSEIRLDRPCFKIEYIEDVKNLDRWSSDAYRCLVLRLAADLAKPITGRISERQIQEEAYKDQLENAKLTDAKENNTPDEAWGDNYYAQAMRGNSFRARPPFIR